MRYLNLITPLVMIFLLVNVAGASSITVSESVSGIWAVDTVFVEDDIDIEEGNSLFIEPGVVVRFQGPYSFYVRGYIRAIGDAGNYISFDVSDTSGFSIDSIPDGGWNGIHFYQNNYTADSSVFAFCKFNHGKAVSSDSLENYGGAFCLRRSDRIRITHCSFGNNFAALNGGAMYIDNSPVTIEACDFYENRCGPVDYPWGYGGAICSDNSSPLIYGNNFYMNRSTGTGGAVAIRFKDARVVNNAFFGNISALGGAIAYLHYYEYPFTQCNNLMYGNSSEFFGGAIACLDAGPTFANNTVSENYSTYGGAFYVKDSLIPEVYNCIFYGDTAAVGPEVYLWDTYASANFYYCDIKGGTAAFGGSGGSGYQGVYENNLDEDPLFIGSNIYRLNNGSPCIDAGTPDTSGLLLPPVDLDGYPRIDPQSNRIDMGCYESLIAGIDNIHSPGESEISIFPNPASDMITVRSSIFQNHSMVIIRDISGKKKAEIRCRENQQEMTVDISDYRPGMYFIIIQNNSVSTQKSFIVN